MQKLSWRILYAYRFGTGLPHLKKCHIVVTIPWIGRYTLAYLEYFCPVEERLGGYLEKKVEDLKSFFHLRNSSQ